MRMIMEEHMARSLTNLRTIIHFLDKKPTTTTRVFDKSMNLDFRHADPRGLEPVFNAF